MAKNLPENIQRLMRMADAALEHELLRKEEIGSKHYGEYAFLDNPTVEMAMDEIVDFINYGRYTYRKLYMLNVMLQKVDENREPTKEGFIPNSQLLGDKE